MRNGLALVATLAISLPCAAHDPAGAHTAGCARYLGNEGVVVGYDGTRVAFDAFYEMSFQRYALVPEALSDALIEAEPPLDNVVLLFVSHIHGDHFSPEPALRFLRARPDVQVLGSLQIADSLRKAGAEEDIMRRVKAFDLAPSDDAVETRIGDVDVSVAAIPHSGGQRMAHIQNLSFRATLGDDLTVVHMGDAGAFLDAFAHHESHWLGEELDLALPPYWLFQSAAGRRIVDEYLSAGQVIGVHVPADAAGRGDALREEAGYDLFTDPGETRSLAGSEDDCAPFPAADSPEED